MALGLGLKRAGFGVSIAATADFRPFIESYGLECVTTDLDLRRAVADPQGGPRGAKWAVFQTLLAETERLRRGADCVICSPTTTLTVPQVAEKLGIPAFPALLQPYLDPTGRFPAVMMPFLPVGGRIGELYNLLTTEPSRSRLGFRGPPDQPMAQGEARPAPVPGQLIRADSAAPDDNTLWHKPLGAAQTP